MSDGRLSIKNGKLCMSFLTITIALPNEKTSHGIVYQSRRNKKTDSFLMCLCVCVSSFHRNAINEAFHFTLKKREKSYITLISHENPILFLIKSSKNCMPKIRRIFCLFNRKNVHQIFILDRK